MAEQTKERNIKHTHVNKIRTLLLTLHIFKVLINTIDHKNKHSFEDVFRKEFENVLGEAMVAEIFAQALEDVNF